MSNESIFLIYCELAGDSSSLRAQGLAGAFVTCFVATDDICEAIEQSKKALAEDGYRIVDVDKAIRFEADEWASSDPVATIAHDVRRDRKLRYSNFDVWGH